MDLEIDGERALVLAASAGIGLGCAEALVQAGCRVVINGRDRARGERAAAALGPGAHFVQGDVANPEDRARLHDEASTHLGAVSILVTNAGGPPSGKFLDFSPDDWRQAFELSTLSAIDLARRSVPGMIAGGFGRIVNISSMSAKEPSPGTALANAVKPALLGAFSSLAREVADKGVTVNSILTGPIDTPLLRRYANALVERDDVSADEALELLAATIPARRIGTPADMGALCAFLSSRRAGFITAQSIACDGGLIRTLF